MIRVHVREGFLGEQFTQHHEMQWWGQTPEQIVATYRRDEWADGPIGCSVMGEVIDGEAWARPVPDDCDVIMGPMPQTVGVAATIIFQLVMQAALLGINRMLAPKPKLLDQAAGPESVESPHLSWQGMRTTYGPGSIVPFVYGEVDVAGQVIYRRIVVDGGTSGSQTEKLRVILALGRGEFESIGGDRPGDGEFAPFGVRFGAVALTSTLLRPTPGNTRFWGRLGTQYQTPIDPSLFPGTSDLVAADIPLDGIIERTTSAYVSYDTGGDELHAFTAIVRFPQGLYADGGGLASAIRFRLYYRTDPRQPWQTAGPAFLTRGQGVTGGLSFAIESDPLPAGVKGLVEVQVSREYASSFVGAQVDNAVLGHVQFDKAGSFSYPGVALLGMEIEASEQLRGQTDFRVPVRAKRVRVWDSAWGWSEPTWQRASSPHNFMTFPPGQNPAWIALDFMRSRYGLGSWLTDDMIDLPAFRRLAAFCDQNAGPVGASWNEAAFCFDGVIDTPREAWEQLMTVLATARATPVQVGRRVSVRYQYAGAHSDGSVAVPARQMTQLFTTGTVRNVQLEGQNTRGKPTVIDYQFINRKKLYAQDNYPVHDPDSTVHQPTATAPDRYRKSTQQAYGIVRTSQLYRDGLFEHSAQRRVAEALTFECGPWALAATVGDVIGFQHSNLQPHDRVPTACTIVEGGGNVLSVTVDHEVTLVVGESHRLLVRTTDGVAEVAVTGAQPGGRLTIASPITCKAGDSAVFGIENKLVRLYEVMEIRRAQDMHHELRCVEFVASIHDPVPKPVDWEAGLDGGGPQLDAAQIGRVGDLRVHPDRRNARRLTATWTVPANRARSTVRLHARFGEDAWWVVGETAEGRLELPAWPPHVRVRLCATLQGETPNEENAVQVRIPEFGNVPPPGVSRAVAIAVPDGFAIEWDDTASGDVADFEVRRGAGWSTGRVVYVGRAPRCLDRHPPCLAVPYWVRARGHSGLYSTNVVRLDPLAYVPPGTIALSTRDELAGLGGTLTDLELVGGMLRHAGIEVRGRYESAELDAGAPADIVAYWSAHADRDELDNLPPTEQHFGFGCDSGEAHWGLLGSRPPSPGLPGLAFRRTIDAFAGVLVAAVPRSVLARGDAGEIGANTALLLESRFQVNAVWGPWQEHRDGWRLASRMQVRLTLDRRASSWSTSIHTLALSVYA